MRKLIVMAVQVGVIRVVVGAGLAGLVVRLLL